MTFKIGFSMFSIVWSNLSNLGISRFFTIFLKETIHNLNCTIFRFDSLIFSRFILSLTIIDLPRRKGYTVFPKHLIINYYIHPSFPIAFLKIFLNVTDICFFASRKYKFLNFYFQQQKNTPCLKFIVTSFEQFSLQTVIDWPVNFFLSKSRIIQYIHTIQPIVLPHVKQFYYQTKIQPVRTPMMDKRLWAYVPNVFWKKKPTRKNKLFLHTFQYKDAVQYKIYIASLGLFPSSFFIFQFLNCAPTWDHWRSFLYDFFYGNLFLDQLLQLSFTV